MNTELKTRTDTSADSNDLEEESKVPEVYCQNCGDALSQQELEESFILDGGLVCTYCSMRARYT